MMQKAITKEERGFMEKDIYQEVQYRQLRQAGYGKRRKMSRRRRRRQIIRRFFFLVSVSVLVAATVFLLRALSGYKETAGDAAAGKEGGNSLTGQLAGQDKEQPATQSQKSQRKKTTHPEWTEDYLSISEWARPGEALPEVNNIFVHYTANPGTTAAQNRSYFEKLKDTHETAASAHFIIGMEGEIINCIPVEEMAYAVIGRNFDSISIECCHPDKIGKFTEKTYDSLVELLGWLLEEFDLDTEDILRHYDEGGKKCPLYYVENQEAWEQLKNDVAAR